MPVVPVVPPIASRIHQIHYSKSDNVMLCVLATFLAKRLRGFTATPETIVFAAQKYVPRKLEEEIGTRIQFSDPLPPFLPSFLYLWSRQLKHEETIKWIRARERMGKEARYLLVPFHAETFLFIWCNRFTYPKTKTHARVKSPPSHLLHWEQTFVHEATQVGL